MRPDGTSSSSNTHKRLLALPQTIVRHLHDDDATSVESLDSNSHVSSRPAVTRILAFSVLLVVGTSMMATYNLQVQMSDVLTSPRSLSDAMAQYARMGGEKPAPVSAGAASSLYAWGESQCRDESSAASAGVEPYNVLVTGGAGFVGLHTSLQLASLGHNVIAYDNLNEYYSPELKQMRVNMLRTHDITFVEADVCDSVTIRNILLENKIDRVIHLAAQAGVRYSLDHPMEYTKNNIDCFVELLEVLAHLDADKNAKKIPLVYASSSSVYGTNTKIPFAETDEVIQQASLYGATKKSDELIANVYHNLYGIPSMGLRFFTVYGPMGRPDMAYYKFTDQILKGQSIDMYNHGEMKRDFTYIDDIVNGVIRCLDLPFDTSSNKADVVNLGNNQPEVLRYLIEVVERSVGKKAVINSKPMQPGDVVSTYANVDKARCLLGYEPTTPLDVGIPKFVDWFLKEHGERFAEGAQAAPTQVQEKN